MLFMLSTQPKPGVTREQIVAHLTGHLNPATWEAIRKGVLSHVLFKTGDEPGFFAVLSASSIDDARDMIDKAMQDHNLFDIEVVPVNEFPHFER